MRHAYTSYKLRLSSLNFVILWILCYRTCCEFEQLEVNLLLAMVRKLKFHEQKLLKKVDFINWKVDNNLHESKVLRKYHIRKREDYTKYKQNWNAFSMKQNFKISIPYRIHSRYNKLSRNIREIAEKISALDPEEPFRTESSAQLLEKLYVLGLIPTKWDLNNVAKVSASSFCRRRLPVVMVRSKCGFLFALADTFPQNKFHETI